MKLKITLIAFLVITLLVISCKKTNYELTDDVASDELSLPEKPYDYLKSNNDHRATLGRVLFYDKSLSLNNSVSCASCHQQSKAFCDNLQFSVGLEDSKTKRNSPTIFARQGKMFWDGRANSISDLVLRPIKNHVEMKFESVNVLAEKISKISYYPALFKKAFGTTEIDTNNIKAALSEFLVNFTFSNNKFNRSVAKKESLTASEMLGKSVFFGDANCSRCHKIEDLDPTGGGGGYGSTGPTLPQSLSQANIGLDKMYLDQGVGIISKNTNDYGKFMIPVLLNVEYTAPFMHDGRFKTLEEVVEHYNSGINDHPNLDHRLRDLGALNGLSEQAQLQALDTNKNGVIDPSEVASFPPLKLNLSVAEKKCLVDFLKTLSDPTILTENKFSNPFK